MIPEERLPAIPEPHHELALPLPEGDPHPEARPEHAGDRGRVKARLVHSARHGAVQPAHELEPRDGPSDEVAARTPMTLAGRQHRGNHDRPAVGGRAFQRIVEVLAMGGDPVHERRPGRGKPSPVSERGAVAPAVLGGPGGLHVPGVARGDAQPRHVDELGDDDRRHRCGQILDLESGETPRVTLRDGAAFGSNAHPASRNTHGNRRW